MNKCNKYFNLNIMHYVYVYIYELYVTKGKSHVY